MSKENLYSKEAQEKIKDLVENIDFAMMATDLGNKPIDAIPMSTKKVDDHGNIWFLSGGDSDHNNNIQKDPDTQLLYAKPSDMEFLSVYGQATITRDKEVLKELYGKADDAWFDGVKDPNLTAIKFSPREAYYWDTESNKYVTLFKMLYSAATGDKTDIGIAGALHP